MTSQQLSLSQIARELAVTQAVLSNWQARYDDFPDPVATVGRRRLYSLVDVKEFINRRGLNLGTQTQGARGKEASLVRRSFDLLRQWRVVGIDIQIVVSTLAVLATESPELLTIDTTHKQLRGLTHDDELDTGLTLLSQIPEDIANSLVGDWVQSAPGIDRDRLAKVLRTATEDLGIRGLGADHVTDGGIAQLIRAITPGLEILDMCSGTGRLLHEYSRSVRRMVGQEINRDVALLSRLLARIEGIELEVHREDALQVCHEEWITDGFDAVIADPPMGLYLRDGQINSSDRRWINIDSARRTTGDDFWIQSALAYLRPSDGDTRFRAVILLRASWFFDGPSRAMRSALVKLGYVEAVISLGPGLHPGTGIATSLLILRKTSKPAAHVRLIDAREVGKTTRRTRELSPTDIRSIAAALEGKDQMGRDLNPITVYDVSIADVLANEAVLDVQRHVPDPNVGITLETALQTYQDLVVELQSSITSLMTALTDVDPARAMALSQELSHAPVQLLRMSDARGSNSPLVVFAKSRKQGFDWTRDEVLHDDVVVSALGASVGRVLSGAEFLDRQETWSKIWILRANSRSLNSAYLLTWAKHGGLETQLRRLIAGSTVKTIAARDFGKVTVPLIDLHLQESVAAWGRTIDSFLSATKVLSNTQSLQLEALTSLSAIVFSTLNSER